MNKWILVVLFTAVIGVAALAWLAWRNRGSAEVIRLVAPILIAVLLAAGSMAWTFFHGSTHDRSEVQVVVPAVPGPSVLNVFNPLLLMDIERGMAGIPFTTVFSEFAAKRKPKAPNSEPVPHTSQEFFLDAMEVIMLNWLNGNYPNDWLVVRDFFSGLSGGAGSTRSAEDAAAFGKIVLSGTELSKVLSANVLVSAGVSLPTLALPPGSRLTEERQEGLRTLKLSTSRMTLVIKIEARGGGVLGDGTILAQRIAEYFQLTPEVAMKSVWNHYFAVTFERYYQRLFLWSPDTLAQRKWADEVAERFDDQIGWRKLKADLEKALAEPDIRAYRSKR